jgi:hypothetical protein
VRAHEGEEEEAGEEEWGSDAERDLEELVAIEEQLEAKMRDEFNAKFGGVQQPLSFAQWLENQTLVESEPQAKGSLFSTID